MYEAYFGLKERPFSINPDPRFMFLTAQHQEALAKCQSVIENKMGASAIHGDIGSGKTSLARRLMEIYAFPQNPGEESRYNFALIVHPIYPSAFQLLKEILLSFLGEAGHAMFKDEFEAKEKEKLFAYLEKIEKMPRANRV